VSCVVASKICLIQGFILLKIPSDFCALLTACYLLTLVQICFAELQRNSIELRFAESDWAECRFRNEIFIFTLINPAGSILGRKHSCDLHSDLSIAMARHSLKLAGSPLHLRAFFNVQPNDISGHPFLVQRYIS